MKSAISLFLLVLFASCGYDEHELYGTYTTIDYKNNYDTLWLKPNGVYHRKVYDINKELVLEVDNLWRMEGISRIVLSNWYVNLDDDLVQFPHNVNNSDNEIDIPIESSGGQPQLCGLGPYADQNCYRKVEENVQP